MHRKNLHPGWTCPSKASLQMTSPPTWRCRSSTRRSPRWTSCTRWPLVPSTSPGSSHPKRGGEGEGGAQFKTSEVRNSSWFAGFYSSCDANAAAPAIDSPSNSSSTRHMTPPAAKTHTHTWFWHRLSGGSRRCSPFTHRPTSHLASPLPQPCLDKGR